MIAGSMSNRVTTTISEFAEMGKKKKHFDPPPPPNGPKCHFSAIEVQKISQLNENHI